MVQQVRSRHEERPSQEIAKVDEKEEVTVTRKKMTGRQA